MKKITSCVELTIYHFMNITYKPTPALNILTAFIKNIIPVKILFMENSTGFQMILIFQMIIILFVTIASYQSVGF